MKVNIKKLNPLAKIPKYAKYGDAGMDLTAVSKSFDKYGNISYGTGLAIEIPPKHVGLIFPRSSISKKHLNLANSIGMIDSGYRGEIICKFKPTPHFTIDNKEYPENYEINDRIAQILIIPFLDIEFNETDILSESERGNNGFGSSGE